MDFMKLLGTVFAVFFHPGTASKLNGQRICRRGTERPCYKVSYIQDSRLRLTYQEARLACRSDGGDLLSIETEGEQRLLERFISQLEAGDGDFWIGLRRSPQRPRITTGCPSQYFWLDGSKAKFRNWHWDEPSCGGEMCAVLYHQPSAPPNEGGHFLFGWNDDNCNSKNNFVCKYPEDAPVPSLRPNLPLTTEEDLDIKIGLSESSVSFSDNTGYVSYILCGLVPFLLLLVVIAGIFCYRRFAKRRKTESDTCSSRSEQWLPPAPAPGPYAFSDITKLPHPDLATLMSPADVKKMMLMSSAPARGQSDDYENVPSPEKESGFVTNDIYETCRGQQSPRLDGWVDNEIYG
ncbi:layilin [Aplochiton taeniatus]